MYYEVDEAPLDTQILEGKTERIDPNNGVMDVNADRIDVVGDVGELFLTIYPKKLEVVSYDVNQYGKDECMKILAGLWSRSDSGFFMKHYQLTKISLAFIKFRVGYHGY